MTCTCGGKPAPEQAPQAPEVLVPVPVAVAGSAVVPVSLDPRRVGRLISSGEALREPLLAVAEPSQLEGVAESDYEARVAGCGECCDAAGSPAYVRFDRYSRDANAQDGGYLREPGEAQPLPKRLTSLYSKGKSSPVCLPFVRITRDPAKFRTCLAAARKIGSLTNAAFVYDLVGEHLAQEDQEVFLVILLDVQLRVRAISELARGGRDQVSVPIPDTLRVAIVDGAVAMIVCHNHPSGELVPSEADKQLTYALRDAAKLVKIGLMDHVIVGADGYYSFANKGLI